MKVEIPSPGQSLKKRPDSTQTATSEESYNDTQAKKQAEIDCLVQLRQFCDSNFGEEVEISDFLIFRFACFHKFKLEASRSAIKKCYGSHYLNVQFGRSLLEQLQKRIVLPIAGLRTKDGHQVIYMRVARFVAPSKGLEAVLRTITFFFNEMSQTEEDCRRGVALLVNAQGYSLKNYDTPSAIQCFKAIQGELVPTRVSQVYIIEAPRVFRRMWKACTTLRIASKDLTQRAHFTKPESLHKYFKDGFQQYLPDEVQGGYRDTFEMIEDYVDMKAYDEEQRLGTNDAE